MRDGVSLYFRLGVMSVAVDQYILNKIDITQSCSSSPSHLLYSSTPIQIFPQCFTPIVIEPSSCDLMVQNQWKPVFVLLRIVPCIAVFTRFEVVFVKF